jgi:hypothetical protein
MIGTGLRTFRFVSSIELLAFSGWMKMEEILWTSPTRGSAI